MKRMKVLTGISTALFALALVVGIKTPVNAAEKKGVETASEVSAINEVGEGVPSINVKTYATGNTTKYIISLSDSVPWGSILYFNVYPEGMKRESLTGDWVVDKSGHEYFKADSAYTIKEGQNREVTLYANDLYPGTNNVEAYVYGYQNNTVNVSKITIRTAVIKVPLEFTPATSVKSTSVEMKFTSNPYITGYEIYRKVENKGYRKIAKISKDTFKDTGLTSKTKYSYKVRPYYYSRFTNKTSYGSYQTFTCTTNGSALNLRSSVSGRKVKLSWKKVANATKYEVYRTEWDSYATQEEKNGRVNNGFQGYQLLKSLKKSKTSYTDSKTVAGKYYTYLVKATLKNGKTTYAIQQSVNVSMAFGQPIVNTEVEAANGNKTITWNPVYGATGYEIQKLADGKWITEKVVSASTKTYVFKAPVVTDANSSTYTNYRVYAVKGSTYSDGALNVTAFANLGVITNVAVKSTTNGIQVSWSKVNNASYYQVYRVQAGALKLNKDKNIYSILDWNESKTLVREYVGITAAPQELTVQEKTAKNLPAASRYFYQNYRYSQVKIPANQTTILDFAGVIYSEESACSASQPQWNQVEYTLADGIVPADRAKSVGPQSGVAYQYVVVAYLAKQKTANQYDEWAKANLKVEGARFVYDTTSHTYTPTTQPVWESAYLSTAGCRKLNTATFTAVNAPSKLKSKNITVKSKKAKQVTITIKNVTGVTEYRIYRSTKKKGTYLCIDTIKAKFNKKPKKNKTTYTDKKLKSGKTYYYKIVAVKSNEALADVCSAPSAVKKVKVK